MERLALGNRVREARMARGLTAEQLAGLCGVGAVHIRKIEAGAKLPSIPLFIELCNTLCVSSKYLLQDSVARDITNLHSTLEDRIQRLPKNQADFAKDLLEMTLSYLDKTNDEKDS